MMRDVLKSLLRLALRTAVMATIVAILLARSNPDGPPSRTRSAHSYQVLSLFSPGMPDHGPCLLNSEAGDVERFACPPGTGMGLASFSPWEEGGRRQVIGVGWNRSGAERHNVGLVWMSWPGCEVLDHLPLADMALPVCPPCWMPGARARVLYPGADGLIYRVDFETSRPDGGVALVSAPRPQALAWRAPMPGNASSVRVRDLCRPDDPRMGRKLLASLSYREGEPARISGWQAWWLELDPAGSSVVAAGRLIETARSEDADDLRLPSLVGELHGAPALAYLALVPGERDYHLRVAPVRFRPGSGVPSARASEARTLATGCLPARPMGSSDGRRVTAVWPGATSPRVGRLPIVGEAPRVAAAIGAGRGGRSRRGPDGSFGE